MAGKNAADFQWSESMLKMILLYAVLITPGQVCSPCPVLPFYFVPHLESVVGESAACHIDFYVNSIGQHVFKPIYRIHRRLHPEFFYPPGTF